MAVPTFTECLFPGAVRLDAGRVARPAPQPNLTRLPAFAAYRHLWHKVLVERTIIIMRMQTGPFGQEWCYAFRGGAAGDGFSDSASFASFLIRITHHHTPDKTWQQKP